MVMVEQHDDKMAEDTELERIKKLPPKERLVQLKALEERRKKERKQKEEEEKREADEAKKIIEESLKEIKLDEMLQEIDVPKPKEVKVEDLLDQESFKEDIKKVEAAISEGGEDYAARIEQLLPSNAFNEIQNWYQQDSPVPTRDEFLQMYEHAREAYDTLQQSMQKQPDQDMYSTPSEQLTENVVESMKMMRALGYKMNFFDHHP